MLRFFHDIVFQTARRLDESARRKIADPAMIITPFASKTYNAEFKLAER